MKNQPKKKDIVERRVTVCNRRGLHARASAKFVRLAETFPCRITVAKDDSEVAGTSIMGLLLLAAANGEELLLRAEGPKARAAIKALEKLVCSRFEEGG